MGKLHLETGMRRAQRETAPARLLGWQCVVDLHECRTPHLNDLGWIRETMLAAALRAEATVVWDYFHQFRPYGISGVVIIGESHLAVHVWPERRFAAVDVFTCNTALKMKAAADFLVQAFHARAETTCFARGSGAELADGPVEEHAEALPPGPPGNACENDELYIDEDSSTGGHWFVRTRTIATVKTPHQNAEIVELSGYGKALILDNEIQSVEADEYIYHEALVHPAMCMHRRPERVLIIGGGEGAVAREVLKHATVRRLVMVDIDEEVISLAREHLPSWHRQAFDDPRLELVIADGYEYVARSGENFDVVIVDAVSSSDTGPARSLYERSFYREAKRSLARSGVLVIQGTRCHIRHHEHHRRIRDTLDCTFRHVRSYAAFVPSFLEMWGFVLAADAFDPASIAPDDIDSALSARRLDGHLRYYDSRTHRGLFDLPKDIRVALGEI